MDTNPELCDPYKRMCFLNNAEMAKRARTLGVDARRDEKQPAELSKLLATPEFQSSIMRKLMETPRVMNIGLFPECQISAARWRARMENYRYFDPTDPKENYWHTDNDRYTTAASEYGDLVVKTFSLSELMPGVQRIQEGKAVVDSVDAKTQKPVKSDNSLTEFAEVIKTWFSHPTMAFVKTNPATGKEFIDEKTGKGMRLHMIVYNEDAEFHTPHTNNVDEIARAIKGTKLDIGCWCFRIFVLRLFDIFQLYLSHESPPVIQLPKLPANLAEIWPMLWSHVGFPHFDVPMNRDQAMELAPICMDVYKGRQGIEEFLIRVLPLMKPPELPGADFEDLRDEIRRTWNACHRRLDFGRTESMFDRQRALSRAAESLLRETPWGVLFHYIVRHYPLGDARLQNEKLPDGSDPNSSPANREFILHVIDLHPAVRARRTRLLRQAEVQAKRVPMRIAHFPFSKINDEEWEVRLDKDGLLPVKMYYLGHWLPELRTENYRDASVYFRNIETDEDVPYDDHLAAMEQAIRRLFSFPRRAFVETERDGKTPVLDFDTKEPKLLDIITYNPESIYFPDAGPTVVRELVRALRGQTLTMDCWFMRPLVQEIIRLLPEGKVPAMQLLDVESFAARCLEVERLHIATAALPVEQMQKFGQLCAEILEGKGDVDVFIERFHWLMTLADEDNQQIDPGIKDEIKQTWVQCRDGFDYGQTGLMWRRQTQISLSANYMLKGYPWSVIFYYIRDHYPQGKARLIDETHPNIKYVRSLHPELSGRADLGPSDRRKELTRQVLAHGGGTMIGEIQNFFGKVRPRVRLFKD